MYNSAKDSNGVLPLIAKKWTDYINLSIITQMLSYFLLFFGNFIMKSKVILISILEFIKETITFLVIDVQCFPIDRLDYGNIFYDFIFHVWPPKVMFGHMLHFYTSKMNCKPRVMQNLPVFLP